VCPAHLALVQGKRSANPPCANDGCCVIRRRLVQRWPSLRWARLEQPALRLSRQASSW
jgi:hypothetical protein